MQPTVWLGPKSVALKEISDNVLIELTFQRRNWLTIPVRQ